MPAVSVILSVFRSETTLKRSLEAIHQQTFRDFEVIVVDSSPGSNCERIVLEQFPEVRYEHRLDRLSADAARNIGFEKATGELLSSTDPDVYTNPSWLAALVAGHDLTGGLVFGGVSCFGDRWLDRGAHLCKFDKWLAGGPPRALPDGPSANMLIPRELVERAGGFMGKNHGDTDLCWRVRRLGNDILFVPQAAVEHHHLHSWRSLLRERFERGKEFGELWLSWNPISVARLKWRFLVTLLPVRLATQLVRVGKNAARSRMLGAYFSTIPIVVSGLYCWLLGEAWTYIRAKPPRVRPAPD